MKQNYTLRTSLVAAMALAAPGLAPAANLLFDDFESHTVGDIPTVLSGSVWANSSTHPIIRDEGTATPFGTPNQYVDWDDNTGGTAAFRSGSIAAASNVLTTLSVDFNEPNVAGRNDRIHIGYGIDDGDISSVARRVIVTLDDGVFLGVTGGTGTSYSYATAYRLFMVLNDSGSAVSYTGGGSIASGEAHVWFENLSTNALTFAGVAAGQNLTTDETGYSVGFRANSGADLQQIFLDNVSLDEGLIVPGLAVIPEPSVALLGGLGSLLLLRRRRAA